jgi:protease PrsW
LTVNPAAWLHSHTPLALLPVLAFLAALVLFDSFKLVTVRVVVGLVLVGAVATGAAFLINTEVYERFPGSFLDFSRYVAPIIEEALKAAFLVILIRRRRLGLLVDATIAGFAIGTGFALIENLYYLSVRSEAVLYIQIIRGFGTAIMHGGATATFGLVALALLERRPQLGAFAFLPALAMAVVLHSGFNHLLMQPIVAVLVMVLVLPAGFAIVYRYSERAVRDWMDSGLEPKVLLLRAIRSGVFLDTPAGQYLSTLRDRFSGETLADMLCYLRLQAELSLGAQGVLLMREAGWAPPPVDAETRAKLTELRQVRRSIGRTGLLAVRPLVVSSHKDLWQLTLLDRH